MNDEQLLRYSRHILLDALGVEGQQKFLAAHALVIGAGGLGSPASLYLAAAGVGTVTVVDGDKVDLTNLQRQIVHAHAHLGMAKSESAKLGLARINPEIQVCAVNLRAEGEMLDALVAKADVVLDCSDNFATRHAINQACVTHRKPLVSGAALRFDGQISVFDLRKDGPCYSCLFPESGETEEMHCATMGVFAPLTGIIGAMQAAEALKCLADLPGTLAGRLLLLDALTMQWQSISLARDPGCPVCARTRSGDL